MKNLLKIVTVITVICMLFTCTTAFAASQTTVTTYKSSTNVDVKSTVSDVASGTMVTYLAAKDANGDSTVQESEIKYIDQQTSDGKPMVFSYSLTGNDWNAGSVISNVKYGSNDSAVAAALSNDTVKYEDINFTVTGAQNGDEGATLNTTYIGKGETKSVTVTPQDGYEIKSITVDNTPVAEGTYTFDVSYNQEVVVTVEMISGTHVYLYTEATVADEKEIYDITDGEPGTRLNVVTGIGYYVGGPVDKAYVEFNGCDIDGAHNEYKYEAVVESATSGYFAVQLADAEQSNLKPATKAIVVKDSTEYQSN